jgi:2-desacetyl-2-hydroxyethyl bacteriochlorophyllide A dehydrogenase
VIKSIETMKAIQLVAHGTPGHLRFGEVPDPQPAPDEVVVGVRACGLNRLDLWLEEGGLPIPVKLPRIPGGEIAGEIEQAGREVDSRAWNIGDRVAVQSNIFCGRCEYCLAGDESLCLSGQLLGVQRDGGFAERVAVPARALVRLPDGATFENSAALTLAGSTAMHMLTNRVKVQPGQWVLVIAAASGVGSAAIQIAQRLGAYVVATGSTPQKRELAVRLGAQAAVDSSQGDWPGEVRQLTQKRGVDLVIEHVGGPVLEQAFSCLARGGTIVTCGATAGRQVQFNLWPFFVKQQKLVGSYGRTRADMITTLDWLAGGRLQPVIDRVCALEEVPSAMAALRERAVLGKIVIKTGGPAGIEGR